VCVCVYIYIIKRAYHYVPAAYCVVMSHPRFVGLATHEPYVTILREEVSFGKQKEKLCFRCGQAGHDVPECDGKYALDVSIVCAARFQVT
jgi:hypothetical protein